MKKILFIILIIIPVSLFSEDAREQRWLSRIEKLQNYKTMINIQSDIESGTANLIDEEISSAKNFLLILNKYKTGDDSVKEKNRKYSLKEIETIAADITGPAVSVFYITEMIKNSENQAVLSSLKDEIKKYSLNSGLPVLNIESREADIIIRRYLIEKYMSEYDTLKNKTASDILSSAEYELSRNGYNSNEIDIRETIAASAIKICSVGINKNTEFKNDYLKVITEWNEFVSSSKEKGERVDSALSFAESHGIKIKPEDKSKGLSYIESLIFFNDRSTLCTMTENTVKAESAGLNNPSYEIPDFKGIKTAVDDVDKYRKALLSSMNGSEDSEFIKRIRNNNRGIANKYITQYENLFKREKSRIEKLKQNSKGIIYNEEMFNISEKHFSDMKSKLTAYSDLSSDYIEALYSSWKINPDEFNLSYNKKVSKHIEYLSFMERITADSIPAGKFINEKFNSIYRASIKIIFSQMKNFAAAQGIPANVKKTMKKEQVAEYTGINDNLRLKGNALINATKKNFESYFSLYNETAALQKNARLNSEASLGQEESDRLMLCSKKFSEAVANMNYTSTALKKYAERYSQISDDIKKGGDLSGYLEKINNGTIIPLVNDFNSEKIDSEIKMRDILVKEGNESLSGAIAITQYYARRGTRLKFVYTAEEIKKLKENFVTFPEVSIVSWKMNGRNYRLVDTNASENLKKMINKKAWGNNPARGPITSKENFSADGNLKFSIALPDGWKKTDKNGDRDASLSFEIQSPDLLGKITVKVLKYDKGDLLAFSEQWIKSNGFTPFSKIWNKLNGTDYIMTVAKNRNDTVMDSYLLIKNGYIVVISGTSEKKRYSNLNKSLKEMFNTLEI